MAPSNVRRWYTQDSLLEKWPELAGWRGLQNTAAARDVGNELVAFKPGWGKDQSILQRLGVPITVKYYGDEADAQITRRLDEQLPVLFYLWSPHPLLAKYSLSRMSLPAITNVNEFESGYTDYPPDILEKVFALKLAMTAPPVMEMYLRFQIDVRRAAPRRAAPRRAAPPRSTIGCTSCCCPSHRRRCCRTMRRRKSWPLCRTRAGRLSPACVRG